MKQKIVLTGGKFNKIHPGHVWLLKRAKKLGYLIVVLAHDSHNKKPYAVPANRRKKMVQTLKIADKVVVGDRKRFAKVVERFHPDIIILGYDQKFPDSESELITRKMKIRILRFRKHGRYSTKKLG
jgi:FAD synthetase